jgi:hypothetical protein
VAEKFLCETRSRWSSRSGYTDLACAHWGIETSCGAERAGWQLSLTLLCAAAAAVCSSALLCCRVESSRGHSLPSGARARQGVAVASRFLLDPSIGKEIAASYWAGCRVLFTAPAVSCWGLSYLPLWLGISRRCTSI